MPTAADPGAGQVLLVRTRDQLITRALRQCSAIADGETPSADMIANAADALSDMVAEWDASGIHLWTESEGVVFPQPGQRRYMLDPRRSPDHAAQDWLLSSLASGAAAGANTLTLGALNSNYGQRDIAIGDSVGIVLDSGSIFWSVATYPSPLQIEDVLPSSASSGNAVFVYRTLIDQPLRILSGRRLLLTASPVTDIPLLPDSRLDYRERPGKDNLGVVTSFYYDPQLVAGYFYTWPAPVDVSNIFLITWMRRIKSFNAATDVPDLPQEWVNCLTWNLAREIGPEYDVPMSKYQILEKRAAESMDRCMGFDKEIEPVYFGIDFTPSSR